MNSITSIMFVAFSSTALISSAEKTTYWSFANSYPLTVSARSTTSLLSFGQMYCCFSRPPHFLCNMLNDTLVFDSADEYRFTGTETRPNEIVALAIDRGGMDATGREMKAVRARVVIARGRD